MQSDSCDGAMVNGAQPHINGETEMTKFTIARAFDHKTHGRIGLVNLEADVKAVTIDGKELPATSVEYLLTFALQNLHRHPRVGRWGIA